jgi:diacylglycerol kinase (ATP)
MTSKSGKRKPKKTSRKPKPSTVLKSPPCEKFVILCNPIAGRGQAFKRARAVEIELKKTGVSVELFLGDDASDLVRKAGAIKPDVERVLIAGGDGTFNTVLNGLIDPAKTVCGLIPCGTANMLARDLGLPSGPADLAHIFVSRNVKRVDMGIVGERRFVLALSAGFDALVTRVLSTSRSGVLGYRGYLLPLLQAVAEYRIPNLTVETEGLTHNCRLAMVLSTCHYGGIFNVLPRNCGSGIFRLCIFTRARIPDLMGYSVAALTDLLHNLIEIKPVIGDRILIGSEAPVPVQVDGDYFGSTPVSVSFAPKGVGILVPSRPRGVSFDVKELIYSFSQAKEFLSGSRKEFST